MKKEKRTYLWKRAGAVLLAAVLAGAAAGCGSSSSGDNSSGAGSSGAAAEECCHSGTGTAAGSKTDGVGTSGGGRAASNSNGDLEDFPIATSNTGIISIVTAIATEEHIYEEEGLNVIPTYTQTNMDALSPTASGKLKLATTGGSVAPWSLIEDGANLEIIGGTMSEGAAIYTTEEKYDSVRDLTPEELEGKTIGVTRTQSGDIAFRYYLKQKGADLSKINFAELDSQNTIIEALKKGTIDLGILFVQYREVGEKEGLVNISQIGKLYPGFICCRITANKDQVEKDRDHYVAFLRAQLRAYEIYRTGSEDQILKDADAFYEVDQSEIQSWIDYGEVEMSPDPLRNNIINAYDMCVDIGYLDGSIKPADYIDTSLYLDALHQLEKENPDDTFYTDLEKEFEKNDT